MLYDKDIREPLFMYFEEKYGKTRVFEEKRMGNSRADILIITEKDFMQFSGLQKNCFYNAIEDAINNKIIARTTRKSIYVVNHNMIFKGNLGEFIAKYKIKYPDGCKVDSNGKIILEH